MLTYKLPSQDTTLREGEAEESDDDSDIEINTGEVWFDFAQLWIESDEPRSLKKSTHCRSLANRKKTTMTTFRTTSII